MSRTARVYDYDSSERLDGPPSKALVKASREAAPSGAVTAFFDVNEGLWQHVPDCDVERYRKLLGETVRTVYVVTYLLEWA